MLQSKAHLLTQENKKVAGLGLKSTQLSCMPELTVFWLTQIKYLLFLWSIAGLIFFCIWVPGLIARVNRMAAGLIARVNHFLYLCAPGQSPG